MYFTYKFTTILPDLDFSVTEASILDMCEGVLGVGTALKVRIATDRDTGDKFEKLKFAVTLRNTNCLMKYSPSRTKDYHSILTTIIPSLGRSKGFAHIDFASQDLASRAVTELNGLELMGRSLRIDFAQRKEDRPVTEYNKEVRHLTTPVTIIGALSHHSIPCS